MKKRFYTTFEIGKICGVFPTTVINWVKEGRLKASHTPGGHRRVTHEDLAAFMHGLGYPPLETYETPGRRILIVDDDESVCRMLKRAFKGHDANLNVETLSSGIDALVQMGKTPPDLAILDVVMPVVDGASLCSSLKENPATRGVKIIAMSGKRLSPQKRSVISKHSDAFFQKPIDVASFLTEGMALLGRPLSKH